MRRGDYGFDAPYFPAIFGVLSLGAGAGAAICWWQGEARTARLLAVYFLWVLRPGGRLVIADIRVTALYAGALRLLGAANVARRRLGWRFWWGNPVAGTTLLTAAKPLE